MHIVFVTAFFLNDKKSPVAGMPAYIAKTTKLLKEKGHEVEIVAGANNCRTWKLDDITVHNCVVDNEIKSGFWAISKMVLMREKALQRKLQEIHKKKKIDIIQYAGWSGIGCLHNLPCASVLRISTYSKIQYKENEVWGKESDNLSFWERRAGRKVTGVISPSIFLGREFEKDIKRKVFLMETPLQTLFHEDDSVYKEQLTDKNYILFFGTASRDKGFDTIIEMMPAFMKDHKDAYFVVAGWNAGSKNGSAYQRMEKRLGNNKERFLVLGPLEQEKLFPVIRNAKAVLIPSLADNFPNACLEAMSLGQVIVGTKGTSLEQVIKHQENGFLSEPGNAKSLLMETEKAYELNNAQREKMRIKSEDILRKYHPIHSISKLERFYKSCMDAYGKG